MSSKKNMLLKKYLGNSNIHSSSIALVICKGQPIYRNPWADFTATSIAPIPVLPLVVRQGHGPDPGIAAWIGEQLLEVRHLPDHDHTVVSSGEQVLPVAAQLDGLVRYSSVQQGRGSRKACPPQPAPLINSTWSQLLWCREKGGSVCVPE